MAGNPVHFEIAAQDTSRAQKFYKDMFGWEFQPFEGPMEYNMARISDTSGAAVFPGDPGAIRVYFDVDDINDGAFDFVRDDKTNRIYLEHGKPIRYGAEGEKGVRQRADGSVEVVDVTDESELLVHDAHHAEPSAAFALTRLTQSTVGATPIGVFRDVERPVYDELMAEQIEKARAKREGELRALLGAGDTWQI